jgi:hypothetical protein
VPGCVDRAERDEVALAAHLDPRNAEAILGIVTGDALDEPGDHLSGFGVCLLHATAPPMNKDGT